MLTAGIFSPRHWHVRGQLQNKDLNLPKWLWIQMSNFVNWNIDGLTKLRSLLKFTEKGWSQQSFDVTVSPDLFFLRCHKSNIATYLKICRLKCSNVSQRSELYWGVKSYCKSLKAWNQSWKRRNPFKNFYPVKEQHVALTHRFHELNWNDLLLFPNFGTFLFIQPVTLRVLNNDQDIFSGTQPNFGEYLLNGRD